MTKLIAEIGINHDGSFSNAKKLIDIASSIDAWGIKFQFRDLKNYLNEKTKNSELGKEILDDEIKKNFLSHKQIISLSKYARKKNLKVGLSLFSKRDYNFFFKYQFDFFKIPSAVSHNYELINLLKKKSNLLIISFGGKMLKEINKIVRDCNLHKKKTVLLHCISNYPVYELNSNLGFIDKLKLLFKGYQIGYSSHERSIVNSILCLPKRIDFLERHITLNKLNKGLDHSSSSDYEELKLFQMYNKNLNRIFFDKKKFLPNQGEILNIQNLGVSYHTKKNLKLGKKLNKEDLELRYPNFGVTDLNFFKFKNKKLIKNISKGEPITASLFKKKKISNKIEKKIIDNKISLPIRPLDYNKIYKEISLKNFEFHLSFKDIREFKIKNFDTKFIQSNNFTIHMPDYCDSNNILDFFSKNLIIKNKSLKLLNKTIKIANQIKNINKKNVNIIASLSKLTFDKEKYSYYLKIKQLVNKIKKTQGINLYPQWLPVHAWYFGGNVETQAFSNPDDFKFLSKIKLNICLDVSHYILGCNYYNYDKKKYFRYGLSIFKHYHLSDAKGIDGEGVLIGRGELIKSGLIDLVMKDKKKVKVLETWQGHLQDCDKFKKDIFNLKNFLQ